MPRMDSADPKLFSTTPGGVEADQALQPGETFRLLGSSMHVETCLLHSGPTK